MKQEDGSAAWAEVGGRGKAVGLLRQRTRTDNDVLDQGQAERSNMGPIKDPESAGLGDGPGTSGSSTSRTAGLDVTALQAGFKRLLML